MPRLDLRFDLADRFTLNEQVLLRVMQRMVNHMRFSASGFLSDEDVRVFVQEVFRDLQPRTPGMPSQEGS
jgi:hypothetical protein